MASKIKIYLKGGQVIEAEVTSLKAIKTDNDLTGLEWQLKNSKQQILYIRLADVSAIVDGG